MSELVSCFLCTTVGPSQDPSGVNIVDSVLVYGQAKSVFGWPDHSNEVPVPAKAPPVTPGGMEEGEEEEEAGESMPVVSSRPLSHLGRCGEREGGRERGREGGKEGGTREREGGREGRDGGKERRRREGGKSFS